MTRITRFLLVLCVTAVLALGSIPFASARPLESSPVAVRTDGGWFAAAMKWLEKVAGVHFSVPSRHKQGNGSPDSGTKDGYPMGGSCVDPTGHGGGGCL